VHAKDVPKVEAYNKQVDDIIQPAHEEAKAMNQAMDKPKLEDLFTNHAGTPGIGQGMMIGGAFAAGGSMLYGGAHMMSPNNSEVNNPIKNMVKGAFVGGIAGAAMLASHNFATGKNFVKASKASDANWFMKKAGEHAAGVSSALNTNVTKGALAAGLIAGSGQFDLTRPVNPVY
jgi:hypothetical protein